MFSRRYIAQTINTIMRTQSGVFTQRADRISKRAYKFTVVEEAMKRSTDASES
jgi:hypothetical protein